MRPADFAKLVRGLAEKPGVPHSRLILGGDHLGPNPWKHLPAEDSILKVKALVKDYVEAGFTKIHLDASMACSKEETPSFDKVAKRAAALCVVAEIHAPDPKSLSYVIGTEVPVPGGEIDDMSRIQVTSPDRLRETVETHKAAFAKAGVPQGMERAVAVVVQPGVDFPHNDVIAYSRHDAAALTQAIKAFDGPAFEAHSTDYQQTVHLRKLVSDHSAILKVGPEITFRFREALVALDEIEKLLALKECASVTSAVLHAMDDNPTDWKGYYLGTADEVEMLKLFSTSDRIRCYWDNPQVRAALVRLIMNLRSIGIPSAIASQFGMRDAAGMLDDDSVDLIGDRVQRAIERYYRASGWL